MERSKFNHNNLQGNDASLETSLREYGFAWVESPTEYLFYYGTEYQGAYTRFGFIILHRLANLREECGHVDFKGLEAYIGRPFDNTDFIQQAFDLYAYDGIVFGDNQNLIYEQVLSGGDVRLKDITRPPKPYRAEEIAGFCDHAEGVHNIRLINAFYRAQDDSDKWPIRGEFNATERAIRRVGAYGWPIYGREYCYALENEISQIVNNIN